MNLDNYNLDELISHIHHEFHHVYEAINKVKNNRYRNYNHYTDFVNDSGDTNLNTIAQALYIVSPEERHARLENFYHEIKGKNYKDSKTYNDYLMCYDVAEWISKYYYCVNLDLFLNCFGSFVEEVCKIKKNKSKTYLMKIVKYLKRWTDDTLKRMRDIDDYINNSKDDEILESFISEDRRRRLFLEFDKAIRRGKMKMHDIN
jgi:hypothetical protein